MELTRSTNYRILIIQKNNLRIFTTNKLIYSANLVESSHY